MTDRKGWECPKCGTAHAPWVPSCNCHKIRIADPSGEVGEEDTKPNADYYQDYYRDQELLHGLADAADVLAEIDVQAAEYVKIALARLRRTPEESEQEALQHEILSRLASVEEWLRGQGPGMFRSEARVEVKYAIEAAKALRSQASQPDMWGTLKKNLRHHEKHDLDGMGECARTVRLYMERLEAELPQASQPEDCPHCDDGEVYLPSSVPDDDGWRQCETCGGSGKLPTPDEIRALRQAYLTALGDLQVAEALASQPTPDVVEGTGDDRAVEAFKVGIDRDTGRVFMSHPRWSLVGMGSTLAEAAQEIHDNAPEVYAMYHGRTDLSAEAKRMVQWLEDFFTLHTSRAHDSEEDNDG